MTFAMQQCTNLSVTDAFRNLRRIARGRRRSQKRRDEQVSESVTRVRQGFGLLWAIPSFFDSTPYWAPSHHCTLVVAAYPIEDISLLPFVLSHVVTQKSKRDSNHADIIDISLNSFIDFIDSSGIVNPSSLLFIKSIFISFHS